MSLDVLILPSRCCIFWDCLAFVFCRSRADLRVSMLWPSLCIAHLSGRFFFVWGSERSLRALVRRGHVALAGIQDASFPLRLLRRSPLRKRPQLLEILTFSFKYTKRFHIYISRPPHNSVPEKARCILMVGTMAAQNQHMGERGRGLSGPISPRFPQVFPGRMIISE